MACATDEQRGQRRRDGGHIQMQLRRWLAFYLYLMLPRITSSSPVTAPPWLQVMAAVVLRHAPFPLLLLLTYTLSGSCNHFLTLIMHEVAHNLAFKRLFANRVFSIIVNLPLGIPAAMWVWEGGREGGVQAPTSV